MEKNSQYINPYAIESNLRLNKIPQSSFYDKTKRFDEYPSLRKAKSSTETKILSVVGPGTYSPPAASRSSLALVHSSSNSLYGRERTLGEPFWPKSESPPVGIYNISRIMSTTPGSEQGIQITSSFKSSGRSKELMSNSLLYKTCHDDITSSNIGPGSYEFVPSYLGQQLISPCIREKSYRTKRLNDINSSFQLSHCSSADMLTNQFSHTKAPLPKFSRKEDKIKYPVETANERQSEIERVRNLPPLLNS